MLLLPFRLPACFRSRCDCGRRWGAGIPSGSGQRWRARCIRAESCRDVGRAGMRRREAAASRGEGEREGERKDEVVEGVKASEPICPASTTPFSASAESTNLVGSMAPLASAKSASSTTKETRRISHRRCRPRQGQGPLHPWRAEQHPNSPGTSTFAAARGRQASARDLLLLVGGGSASRGLLLALPVCSCGWAPLLSTSTWVHSHLEAETLRGKRSLPAHGPRLCVGEARC